MNFEASWGASGENAVFAPPFDGKLPNGDSISNIGSGIPVKEFLFIRSRNAASQFDILYSYCARSGLVEFKISFRLKLLEAILVR